MSNQMTSYPIFPITSASHGSRTRLMPATRTSSPPRSSRRSLLLTIPSQCRLWRARAVERELRKRRSHPYRWITTRGAAPCRKQTSFRRRYHAPMPIGRPHDPDYLKQKFDADGFVRIERLLDEEQVQQLEDELARYLREVAPN